MLLRYITKAFLSIVFFSIASKQVVLAKRKVSKNTIWPTTLYLGVDVAKTCCGWYLKTGNAYEINGSIDFSSILLDADYGFGYIRRGYTHPKGAAGGSFYSRSDGRYFRIGLGWNCLSPTLHHNQFFLGLRYARSFFDFQLDGNRIGCNHKGKKLCGNECIVAPDSFRNVKNSGIAHWWELVVGGKVRCISILSIGCTARYKFFEKIENKLSCMPVDIPGFGLSEDDYAFGYSVYILANIPLQKRQKEVVNKVENTLQKA